MICVFYAPRQWSIPGSHIPASKRSKFAGSGIGTRPAHLPAAGPSCPLATPFAVGRESERAAGSQANGGRAVCGVHGAFEPAASPISLNRSRPVWRQDRVRTESGPDDPLPEMSLPPGIVSNPGLRARCSRPSGARSSSRTGRGISGCEHHGPRQCPSVDSQPESSPFPANHWFPSAVHASRTRPRASRPASVFSVWCDGRPPVPESHPAASGDTGPLMDWPSS